MQEGIIDAAIWIGYAWADEPRNHAVVMVTGDDKDKVTNTAEYLAQSFCYFHIFSLKNLFFY